MRISPIAQNLFTNWVLAPDPLEPPENPYMARPARPAGGTENLLEDVRKLRSNLANLKFGTGAYDRRGRASGGLSYGHYLQFPNARLGRLARSIVHPGDGNDEKAWKVLTWVQENIVYEPDMATYGAPEYWALPTMTADRGEGDCEDGAFLVHSLLLNAGVPSDRLRTFGGLVYAGPGAPGGGHAWTVYRRQTDDEWVALDWCYYANDLPVAERAPIRQDRRYADDFFFVDAAGTVDATFANYIRGSFLDRTV